MTWQALAEWQEIDQLVEQFEAARKAHPIDGLPDVRSFLPDPGSPCYPGVLGELIRVAMEHSWNAGSPRRLRQYVRDFPELLRHPDVLGDVAFEEFRLRLAHGEDPSPEEYQREYGVATDGWPEAEPSVLDAQKADLASSPEFQDLPRTAVVPSQELPPLVEGPVVRVSAALGSDFSSAQEGAAEGQAESCPPTRDRPLLPEGSQLREAPDIVVARAVAGLPEVGTTFLGFRLVGELGRGTFGRVFLAEQGDLANRPVALKVSIDLKEETQTLAQLQHTNIVPIYSVHRTGAYQAVCMPYFGSSTLTDVIRGLKGGELPESGKHLVSTLGNRRSTLRGEDSPQRAQRAAEEEKREGLFSPASPSAPSAPSAVNPPAGSSQDLLAHLEKLSYVEAVLWLASKLADGLAHAHERGIIHRDLKPANILLTDEGQPMLLDFNLSLDVKSATPASALRMGGTVPYMAPEHLEAFGGQGPSSEGRSVDTRSDIYSLGLILFELLTGRQPFPAPKKSQLFEVVPDLLKARRQPPPALRPLNKAVSPAVEAIVWHCLEPDPNRRYQSARELKEDLERHLADLPLRHAPGAAARSLRSLWPCWRERGQKWVRRHPRLTSSTSVGILAALLLLALGAGYWTRSQQAARLQAVDALRGFQAEKREVEILVSIRSPDLDLRQKGLARARNLLARYRVLEGPGWQDGLLVRQLEEADRLRLRDDVADLLFLLARSEALGVKPGQEEDARAALQEALRLNELAAAWAPAERGVALQRQRAALERRLWRKEAPSPPEPVGPEGTASARDDILLASDALAEGNFPDVVRHAAHAVEKDPRSAWAWFLLGSGYLCQGYDLLAEHAFTTCIALDPDLVWSRFNRGLARLRRGDYARARADFDRVVEMREDLADAYLNRALARQKEKDLRGAVSDLTTALQKGSPRTRIYFLRSRLYRELGEEARAREDFQTGLREEPRDEQSWVARGLARMQENPREALADFQKALECNPRYLPALQDQAHVLSERLGQPGKAIAVLDRALELYPQFVPALGGRGVLHARLGQRDKAHADAQQCLRLDSQPSVAYQVAGIYALTSRQKEQDRREALRLLSVALRQGYGLALVDRDPDLEPLRNLTEFRRLVAAARALQGSKP